MSLLTSAISATKNAIARVGRPVTVSIQSTIPYDDAKPWGGMIPDTLVEGVPAVFTNYSLRELSGTSIQAGDKKCLIAKASIPATEIGTKDHIIDGAETWKIMSVKALQPGALNETILYTLQLRA